MRRIGDNYSRARWAFSARRRGQRDPERPWCRYPSDCDLSEEEHGYCWARAVPGHECWGALTEQHRPKRGSGGRGRKTYGEPSRVVAILCLRIHSQLDNNPGRPYRDRVVDGRYEIYEE